jgi:hypothetical protein
MSGIEPGAWLEPNRMILVNLLDLMIRKVDNHFTDLSASSTE